MDWWWIYNKVILALNYAVVLAIVIVILFLIFVCLYGLFCGFRYILLGIEDWLDERHRADKWLKDNKDVILDDKSRKIYDNMVEQLEQHTKEYDGKHI